MGGAVGASTGAKQHQSLVAYWLLGLIGLLGLLAYGLIGFLGLLASWAYGCRLTADIFVVFVSKWRKVKKKGENQALEWS